MPRREGELSPREVAKRLKVHEDTVYRWVARAADGQDSPVKGHARRDSSGRIWIRKDAVESKPFYF